MNMRMTLRHALHSCVLLGTALAGCHKPEQPEPYEPCAGKYCGEPCSPCPVGTRFCPAEQEPLFCDADGSCVPTPSACNTCDAYECPEWYSCFFSEEGGPLCYNAYFCGTGSGTRQCPFGSHCEVGSCEPDDADVPSCGGPDALTCPGEGTCVDDPNDDCNPDAGTGCPGKCQCLIDDDTRCFFDREAGLASCWDATPAVCGCGPVNECGEQAFCCQDAPPTGPFPATQKPL